MSTQTDDEPCCEAWGTHIGTIDSIMQLSHELSALPDYEGPMFAYCPFCGTSKP